AGEIGGWLCPVGILKNEGGGAKEWVCKQLRPLEEIASVPALLKAVRAAAERDDRALLRQKGELTLEDVVQAAQQGDPVVAEVLETIAQTLGWVVCQADTLFKPEKIILA